MRLPVLFSLLRSKQHDCDRPLCLRRLSPVLSRSTLMVMVMVALADAVADRPLLLRDENPMPRGVGVERTGFTSLHVLAA